MSEQSKKLQSSYQTFFLKSFEGQEFIKELERMISAAHEKAEKDGDKARDYTQEARGVRGVIEHIQSITAVIKKGTP